MMADLIQVWDNIEWAFPYAVMLLPLPLLVYYLFPAYQQPNRRALKVPLVDRYSSLTYSTTKSHGRTGLILLFFITWLALLVALARPQSYGEPISVPASGRDLMLGIDISGSMREDDLYAGQNRATRIAVVKQVARDFIDRRTGDRVGLIMFGSQAYTQTPLTYDHQTVQHFLDEAVVGLAGRSTAIGDAIGLAVKRLRERPDTSRVLVLLTDGENSAGVIDPIAAAQLAAEHQIRIYTIGVGSDVQESFFSLRLSPRRSELDETTLKEISQISGGRYFRARNQQELAQIYSEIDRLEPTESDANEFRPLKELYSWPLGIAFISSLLLFLLRNGFFSVNYQGNAG